jgi:hypothetical protein
MIDYLILTTFLALTYSVNLAFVKTLFMREESVLGKSVPFLLGSSWFLLMAETGFAGLISIHLKWSPFFTFLAVVFLILISLFTSDARNRIIVSLSFQTKFVRFARTIPWFLLVIFIFTAVWLVQTENTIRPQGFFTMIGSLHTGKYVFISDFIRQCQTIPFIQSSFGQSIFVATMAQLTKLSSVLLLYLALSLSILAFYLVVRALIHYLIGDLPITKSFPMEIVVICGTFSLSTAWVLVNDSGNPIIFTGYSDTIYGIFVILAIFLFANDIQALDKRRLFVTQVLLFSHAYIAAPQVFPLMLVVGVLALARSIQNNLRSVFLISTALFTATGIWFGKTGMLLANVDKASENFPGIGKAVSSGFLNDISLDSVSPGIPYMVGNSYETLSEIYPQGIQSAKLALLEESDFSRIVWHIEQLILTSLRPIFWPLAGIMLLYVYGKSSRNRNASPGENGNSSLKILLSFCAYSALITFTGLVPAFLFAINSHKWEMARFSFPGLVLGMICLVIFLTKFLTQINRQNLLFTLLILLILPSLLHLGYIAFNLNQRASVVQIIDTPYGNMGFFSKPLEMRCESFAIR